MARRCRSTTRTLVCVLVCCAALAVFAAPAQNPVMAPDTPRSRALRGRFLHITDIHLDPYYLEGTSQSTSCHRKKKKKKDKPLSGYYGAPDSDCDSPYRLADLTLDHLEERWASKVDFVVWTGDTARHDNDRKVPRTPDEINTMNRYVADRMWDVFARRGVPVVPSLGNNDIWPHNIMTAGPNRITSDFAVTWQAFIPFPDYQVFRRGAYCAVEVVPDALAVIALNSMYFAEFNKAVGGCEPGNAQDPGNLEFDWLEVQLERFRKRGMQVWITGHVPPAPGAYFPECHTRYVELSLRFQDTIVGHLYGHMNIDHFFFLEKEGDAAEEAGEQKGDTQITKTTTAATTTTTITKDKRKTHLSKIFKRLLSEFTAIAKKGADEGRYVVVNVAPSVVPTYVPTYRVFEYNVSGVAGVGVQGGLRGACDAEGKQGQGEWLEGKEQHGNKMAALHERSLRADQDWPSRRNTLWSPLGYEQYYMPGLRLGNETVQPMFEVEYVTFPAERMSESGAESGREGDDGVGTADREAHGEGGPSIRNVPGGSLRHRRRFRQEAPYGMCDLTVGSWLGLARRLADPREKELREWFERYMGVG